MKRFKPYFPLLPICLLLLLVMWHSQTPPASEAAPVAEAGGAARPARALAERASPGSLTPASMARREFLQREASDLELPKPEELRWEEPMPEPIFEEFRRWTAAAQPAARSGAVLQHGVELARQRRAELLELIEKNPRRALELAVPDSLRRQLPDAIVALLEERVDAQGDLMVQSTTLDNDRGCMIERTATLQNGEVFEVHTYGRRGAMPTRDNIAIHGVALDGKLALSELPGRVLEPSEVAVRVGDGQILIESADSADNEQPTDAADGSVIAFGDGRMVGYRDETQAVAALLLEEDAERSGATAASADDLDGVIAYSPRTEGRKTMLIIRVDFPDYQGGSASNSALQSLISDVNSVYTDMSFGKASFALDGQGSVITPVLRLPNNVSYYTTNSFSRILTAARTAAANAGFNHTDYTYEVVVTGAQPLIPGVGGVAFVGARGTWLCNSQWNLKTCAHELGHNFGLPHAGAWDTDNGSVIGPGEVWGYGNVFDMMGVGPSPHANRHFGAGFKEYLDWLPTSDVVKITTNGLTTTRIRAMDKMQADGNKRVLVVDRPGNTNDYWIEHRQLYGTNYGMRDGVLVNWANIDGGYQQPLLLDMRPDTSEKTDAVLPIGKTFSDTAAGVHITPVGRGTDPDGVNWIDVTIRRGTVAGNLPPVASIGAPNANPAVNASVTFTCTASDPNGDTLAYFWDWGNGTTTVNNSPTASKSWPAAGIYIVRCTVSDMKGLSTTAEYVVQVGATTTFFIEGVARTIQGDPLQGVVVTASPTAMKATTDATGRYIITGLAAGNYTLTATSGTTPDGFTNPVAVGPSLQGRNFLRQSNTLTWDADSSVGGAQDGAGTWAENGGNWRIAATGANNQKWKGTNLDSALFGAGVDGNYAVNFSGVVQVGGGITFANSGYRLGGGTPQLHDDTNNSPISVAASKSATINSTITYLHNKRADITVDPGAVLNLGGGASNSQYAFNGAGTVNMTAGTYAANVGSIAAASFNQSGGIFDITPANNGGYSISSNSRNVTFTVSGGTLNVNGNASTATVNNSFLAIGNGTATSNTSTMVVKNGATVSVGTTASRSGEIRIANTPQSNGALDVQGGTLTVGTGSTENKIYFFKAGTIDAPYFAGMSQSGGTVTANGIQFGGDSGTYDSASSAFLTLSGGSLYVGAQGITRGSAAADLAVEIQLQGGTLGASQNWSSSLDMQLGAVLGGVTIRAQDAAGTARNITLTGNLSDDSEVSGALIKTGPGLLVLGGANTFTGGLAIRNGTVEARTNNAALGAGTVVMGGTGSDGATLLSGRTLGNAITVNAPDSGAVVIGANGNGSGFSLLGPIALDGNLTLQTANNPAAIPPATTRASAILTGGVTGSGNLLLNNIGLAANTITINTTAINHTGTITLKGTGTGDTTISAAIGSNVTGITQDSATSTMILSGANTYACNLTVNAGTVRISNNTNTANDTSTVTIAATGATLDLTYAGTDGVDKLFIGTTEMPAGVYGRLGSVLPVIGVAQITGDGTLTVGIPVTPPGFSSWIAGEFANGAVPIDQRDPDDDPDNDGIPNLMEYAIAGLDPTMRNPTYGSFTGNTLSFTKREGATGLSYAILESTDLGHSDDWTEVAGGSYVNDSTTISYTLAPPTPPKNFLRLRVVQN